MSDYESKTIPKIPNIKERENKCKLNSVNYLFDDKNEDKKYSCSCSNNPDDLFCENCIDCHEHHDLKEVKESNNLAKFICKCTHNYSNYMEEEILNQTKTSSTCKTSNLSEVYVTKKSQSYCYFCYLSCIKKYNLNLKRSKKLKESYTPEDESQKVCQCKKKHKFLDKINYIIKYYKAFESYLNLPQILPILLKNLNQLDKPFNSFYEYFDKFQEDGHDVMKFLIKFSKIFNYSDLSDKMVFSENLKKHILNKLNSKSEIKLKISYLKALKQFYIDPKLPQFHLVQADSNITIFHRWLFCENLKNFIESINIPSINSTLEYIFKNIKDSFEAGQNIRYSFKLILVLLDYLVLFSTFKFEKPNIDLLSGLSDILESISKNECYYLFFCKVSNKIEIIVYNLLIKNNDDLIYSRVFEKSSSTESFSYSNNNHSEKLIKILFSFVPIQLEREKTELEKDVLRDLCKNQYKYTTIKCIDLLSSKKDMYYITNKQYKYDGFTFNNYIFHDYIKEYMIDNTLLKLDECELEKEFPDIKRQFIKIKKDYFELKKSDCDHELVCLLDRVKFLLQDKSILKIPCDHNETKRMALFRKQLALYKCGFVDTILDMWQFFHFNFLYWNQTTTLENGNNDLKKNTYLTILEILTKLSVDNPIIISILLTETYLEKINKDFNNDIFDFYLKLSDNLKKMEFNVDMINLICELERFTFTKIEISSLLKLINLLRICVEVNITHNFSVINKKVTLLLQRIISNKEIKYYLETFWIHDPNFKMPLKKKNTVEYKLEIESKDYFKKFRLAKRIVDCTCALSSECFNIISQEILNLGFENIFKNNDLLPKYRKSFFHFYSKYYFGHHQKIQKNLNFEEFLNISKEEISCSSINKDLNFKEDEYKIENCVFENKYTIKSVKDNDNYNDEKASVSSNQTDMSLKIIFSENEYDNLQIYSKRLEEDPMNLEVNDKSPILEEDKYEVLIQQLQKFPSVLKIMNNKSLGEKPIYILDYFMKAILYPTEAAIFKNIYNNKTMTLHIKLQIIRIVTHFFQCYELVLKIIRNHYVSKRKLTHEAFQFLHFDLDPEFKITEYKNKLSATLKTLQKYTQKLDTDGIYNLELKRDCLDIFNELRKDFNGGCNIWKANYDLKTINEEFLESYKTEMSNYKNGKNDIFNSDLLIFKIYDENEIIYDNIRKNIITNILDLLNQNLVKSKQKSKLSKIFTRVNKSMVSNLNTLNYKKDIVNLNFVIALFTIILKLNPGLCQITIIKKMEDHTIFKELMMETVPFFYQSVINDFKSFIFTNNFDKYKYDSLLDSIEFLRLLCENHNKFFQFFIFNYRLINIERTTSIVSNFIKKKFSKSKSFVKSPTISIEANLAKNAGKDNFVALVLNLYSYIVYLIKFSQSKKEYDEYLYYLQNSSSNEKIEFYNTIINKFTDFLIEICQGSVEYNFKKTLSINDCPSFWNYFFNCHEIISEFQNDLEEEFENILLNFVKFLITFLEEDKNPVENKKAVLKHFDTTKLLFLLIQIMKKFYSNIFQENKKINNKKLLDYYKHKMKRENENTEKEEAQNDDGKDKDILLKIGIKIFLFIRLSSLYDKKFMYMYEDLKSSSEIQDREMNYKKEIFLFFDKIVKNVEIFIKEPDDNPEDTENYIMKLIINKDNFYNSEQNQENKLRKNIKNIIIKQIFFECHPVSLMITNYDIDKFVDKASDENRKLYDLLKFLPKITDTLKIRQDFYNNHQFIYKVQSIKVFYKEIISVFFVLIINILVIFSLSLTETYEVVGSIDLIIDLISFTHLLIISFFILISLWYHGSNLKMYTHPRRKKEKNYLDFSEEILDYIKLIVKTENFPLLWNFFFGFLAFINKDWRFFFSIQLFTVFNLSTTMNSAVYTVKQKYSQFISTILMIIIISMLFASISFIHYNDLFWSEDIQMNMCDTFFHCFLTIFNVGFIAGSVDFSNIISFEDPRYWSHFIYSWSYYFFISIIMVNIINAIIVDTFQDIRENNNIKFETINNSCIICSYDRSKFELIGHNFNTHLTKEHNLRSYFKYLIKIRLTNKFDLNQVDSYVMDCIEDNKTTFFPIKNAIILMPQQLFN